MYLGKLALYHLRNLDEVQLDLLPTINLFSGANGSGKTSILEGAYLLGRGRSFRSSQIGSVIQHGQSSCTVYGLLTDPQGDANHHIPLGVTRYRDGGFTLKMAGAEVRSAAKLAKTLPQQLLNADSFYLLEGGASNRRMYMDWGVFHVEPEFASLWRRFQRCLKHRNSLLRSDKIDGFQLSVWDGGFVHLAEQMNGMRHRYLQRLLPSVERAYVELTGLSGEIEFGYACGWDSAESLQEILKHNLERDRILKNTQYGPHRADMRIRCNGHPVAKTLSRGQLKVLVYALKLAQGFLHREITGRECIYLLDDFPSELDNDNRQRVAGLLVRQGCQVLATGTQQVDFENLWGSKTAVNRFHVEHGAVTPC